MNPTDVLAALWALGRGPGGALPEAALAHGVLSGADPVLPSSYAVGTAAQTGIAAAALAACELGHVRGQARQTVAVDMRHAAAECSGWFSINGQVPELWDRFSGLYRCADGWVRIHANFAHHRDGALRLMGLPPDSATRADAEAVMRHWHATDFEQAAAQAGLVVAALRRPDEWDSQPQGQAIATQPLMTLERMGDAAPLPLPPLTAQDRPLTGLRVLDLTRILAGPVCGRTLAAYGAQVMLLNAPHLPNIASIADTSRGKLSAHLDLRTPEGQAALAGLLGDAHVFIQGYRPGGLDALGCSPHDLVARRPGLVYVSLSAYGAAGPWQSRRGFDSLVQTAMGFNHAEGEAAGTGPRPLPMQILDYATGHLMAFAVSAALHRQQQEGGSWHVRLSLAQTGLWLRSLGRVAGFDAPPLDHSAWLETRASGFGDLVALRHSAGLSRTPAGWVRPSMPPGSHAPVWL